MMSICSKTERGTIINVCTHYLAGRFNSNQNKDLTKVIATWGVHDSVSIPLLSSFPERSEVGEREFVLELEDPPPIELHL